MYSRSIRTHSPACAPGRRVEIPDRVPTAHLPEAREPRSNRKLLPMPGLKALVFGLKRRPGAHDALIAFQYTPQLWKLVQAQLIKLGKFEVSDLVSATDEKIHLSEDVFASDEKGHAIIVQKMSLSLDRGRSRLLIGEN